MRNTLKKTLHTIKSAFSDQSFTIEQLQDKLIASEHDLSISTLRWRLYTLKAQGKIESLARGKFALSKHINFELRLEPFICKISKEIKKQFPYAKFCIWQSDFLNQFTIHVPSTFFHLVEVEKLATQSVFSFLQEHQKNIFLNPNKKEIDLYLLSKPKSIIVKTLYQRAPLTTDATDKYSIPKLEKILVDVLADTDIFSIYQGSELKNIWREICNKYAINFSTLNNYAKRRKVDKQIQQLISELELLTTREHK